MIISLEEVFTQPEDYSKKIWRYFDLAKFLDLLNSSSLFFSRSDQLGDKFEGSLSFPTSEDTKSWINSLQGWNAQNNPLPPEQIHGLKKARSSLQKHLVKSVGISCWHLSDYESAAMWSLYSKSKEGIAIQSTYLKLYDILDESDLEVFLGVVKYIDYHKVDMGPNILSPFIHKWHHYEHEKEIRAVYNDLFPGNNNYQLKDGGCKVKINLSDLVENIVVSPDTPKWQFDLIQDLVQKYLPNINIKESSLKKDPLY